MPGSIATERAAPRDRTVRTAPRAVGHAERLALRARRGDRVARTKLVEEHMGLVRAIAFRYRERGLPLEDLVQEGAIGLLQAVDDYDPERGSTFSTYAFWRIRAAITHALTADGSLVHIPRTVLERRRRVAAAREELMQGGCNPTLATLARTTKLSERQVAEAVSATNAQSLDAAMPDGRAQIETIADPRSPEPEAELLAATQTGALRDALHRLSTRKRTIVDRHFGLVGESSTLAQIGADLRLSPERVRSLEDEALRELASDLAGVG